MPTVLIVESDPLVRNLMRDILARNGYIVLDAVNAAEAIRLLGALPDEDVDLTIARMAENAQDGFFEREAAALRPAMKVLLTIGPHDAPPTDNVSLRLPFSEARLVEAVAGLISPTIQ